MPKYLWKVSYAKAGVRGPAKEGASSRRDAVRHAIESLGGGLEAVYFAFGERMCTSSVSCRTTKALLPYRWLPT